MKYAIYLIVISALVVGLFFHRRRKRVSRRYHHKSIAVFTPGRDPIKDRIEFHLRNRD